MIQITQQSYKRTQTTNTQPFIAMGWETGYRRRISKIDRKIPPPTQIHEQKAENVNNADSDHTPYSVRQLIKGFGRDSKKHYQDTISRVRVYSAAEHCDIDEPPTSEH